MPSIAVHLTIAAHLADSLGIKDMPAYYLGTIAPDSVNVDGFASQEARYGAHIRSRDPEMWKKNIRDHKAAHQADYADEPDFFKGFLLHLYTDIAWDEVVQPQLFDYLRSLGYNESELNSRKWDELRGFDSMLSKGEEYVCAVKALGSARPTAVSTVTPELMERWRDKIAALEYLYPPPGFLGMEHIEAAREKAFELMTNE